MGRQGGDYKRAIFGASGGGKQEVHQGGGRGGFRGGDTPKKSGAFKIFVLKNWFRSYIFFKGRIIVLIMEKLANFSVFKGYR